MSKTTKTFTGLFAVAALFYALTPAFKNYAPRITEAGIPHKELRDPAAVLTQVCFALMFMAQIGIVGDALTVLFIKFIEGIQYLWHCCRIDNDRVLAHEQDNPFERDDSVYIPQTTMINIQRPYSMEITSDRALRSKMLAKRFTLIGAAGLSIFAGLPLGIYTGIYNYEYTLPAQSHEMTEFNRHFSQLMTQVGMGLLYMTELGLFGGYVGFLIERMVTLIEGIINKCRNNEDTTYVSLVAPDDYLFKFIHNTPWKKVIEYAATHNPIILLGLSFLTFGLYTAYYNNNILDQSPKLVLWVRVIAELMLEFGIAGMFGAVGAGIGKILSDVINTTDNLLEKLIPYYPQSEKDEEPENLVRNQGLI